MQNYHFLGHPVVIVCRAWNNNVCSFTILLDWLVGSITLRTCFNLQLKFRLTQTLQPLFSLFVFWLTLQMEMEKQTFASHDQDPSKAVKCVVNWTVISFLIWSVKSGGPVEPFEHWSLISFPVLWKTQLRHLCVLDTYLSLSVVGLILKDPDILNFERALYGGCRFSRKRAPPNLLTCVDIFIFDFEKIPVFLISGDIWRKSPGYPHDNPSSNL